VSINDMRGFDVAVPPWEDPWYVLVYDGGEWRPRSVESLGVVLGATFGPPRPPLHVPGPTPSGRRKGNVPPKVLRKPIPFV